MAKWQIALRSLRRRPGYAATAILMLVLGIGATATLFSLVDTVLLKPLPFPDGDRLVTVLEASPSKNKKSSLIAPVRLEDWNRMNRSFAAIAGNYAENVTDTSGSEPERLAGRRVSPRFFEVYGMAPLLGRWFSEQENLVGGPGAALISYGMWTRRYGQDHAVIGRRLLLGARGYTIVGVMPKNFASPAVDLWLPAQINPNLMRSREARFYTGLGRLKPGITIAQARMDLAAVQHRLGEQYPQTDRDWSAVVSDMKEARVGEYRRTLLLVFGAVGLLMLITVANIAGLTLADLHQREREMAVRSSVGASRGQVVATVMREVLTIATAGGLMGGVAAFYGVKWMARIFPDLPRIAELQFDWRAVMFTASTSMLAAALFGLIPSWLATRGDSGPMLIEAGRNVAGGNRRLQRVLVVAQLAFTVLLLSSAGLLLRSYYHLTRVDAGFRPAQTTTFHVGAAWDEDRSRIGGLQMDIMEGLKRLPGTEEVGFTNFLPATGATLNYQVVLEGIASTEEASTFTTGERSVSKGYLEALKVPLLSGSWCPVLQAIGSKEPAKMLVNRKFVELFAQGRDVIGRRVRFAQDGAGAPGFGIAGVVGDVREDGLNTAPGPYVYACMDAGAWPDPEYVVRSNRDARTVAQQIRGVIQSVAPGRAVFGVKGLSAVLDDALDQPRVNSRFLGLFAIAAMLLAAVGLYSLIALTVAARRREIGVRIALGAERGRIIGMILSGAGRLFVSGILIGLGLSVVAERILRSALFEVSPLDGYVLTGAVSMLGLISTLAAYLPARRAAGIDPLEAMRTE